MLVVKYPFLLVLLHVGTDARPNNACSNLYHYPIKDISPRCYVSPNVMSSTPKMIMQNGYTVETYYVTTSDGYILQLFRIPPKNYDYRKNKQPIVLQHGIVMDTRTWVFIGNRSLAFNLADRGYDVWLSNQRGTKYSSEHVKYKISDFEYWLPSLDVVALNDVPAVLNKIANVTGKAGSIIYIGHSRGATLVFMYASERPKEAQKFLKGIIALAPVVYPDMVWYIKVAATVGFFLRELFLSLNISALLYPQELVIFVFQKFCTIAPIICKLGMVAVSGKSQQFLSDDLLAFFSFFPAPIAVTHLAQFAQIFRSGLFRKYDYGTQKNFEIYGQEDPPLCNLTKIKIPTHILFGKNDALITERSTKRLFEELGSTEKSLTRVPVGTDYEEYQLGHNDMFLAKDIEKLVYPKLFESLKKLK